MSVIIHGLNMPKSCDECRLFNECWCMALSVENWRKSYNKPPEGGRLPDCPLVPLPEGHGRLVDLDALINKLQTLRDRSEKDAAFSGNREAGVTWDDAINIIISAPVIVPAEGVGEK